MITRAIRYVRRVRRSLGGRLQKLKRRYYEFQVRSTAKSVGSDLFVNHPSRVNANTILGNNVNLNGFEIHGQGQVVVGDNAHIGRGCVMITENHNFEGDAIPYDSTYIRKGIRLEDNVWFGLRVMVLPGVTIGEGAIIQAGSVVVNDIPRYAIAGGHPARVFAQRNVEHYERLKKEGRFH